MLSSAASISAVPVRRNGRKQACEACRKRKMACDHTLPTCQRCRVRSSECIYLVGPTGESTVSRSSVSGLSKSPRRSPTASTLSKTRRKQMASKGSEANSKPVENVPRSSTLFCSPSAYLGPESFSSIFLDNANTLPLGDSGLQDLSNSVQASTSAEIEAFLRFPVRTARKIISAIPAEHASFTLFEARIRWASIGIGYIHDMLWKTHGHLLDIERGRSESDLDELALLLYSNSKVPLQESDDTMTYLAAFTGSGIRWESLGLLFVKWAYGAMAATIPATFFSSKDSIRRSREQFILEMKSSAQFCIQLCNETDLVNPLLITLLYNYNLLVSVMMGDTSVTLWRLHGDLVCGATALGLHRESPKTKSEISLALEIRRRAHAAVFGFDKAHASFTGRPITLPRRYCTAVLPLDLPDEDLLLPNDELRKKAGEELDENGWNTRGAVYPATTLRVFYLMALIREEILELNLATTDEDLDAARILDLKDRALQQYEAFPSMLKYQAGEIETAKSDPTLWSRACTRLRYVQNIYLIERLLQKTGYSNGQELLETAKESLGLCLKFYVYRDTFAEHQFDFEWMIMCYAVPAAGALCLELLKQSNPATSKVGQLKLSRSETIQNLTMLVVFLDWVKPGNGNYQLCQKTRTIISTVLDHVLEGPSADTINNPDAAESGLFDLEWPNDWSGWNELGDVGLDTLDWVQMPWSLDA